MMLPDISVCLASRNDPLLVNTVHQIRATAPDAQILVWDDASDPRVRAMPGVQIHRSTVCRGCSAGRHFCAMHARHEWLFITDAHMRFSGDWLERARGHLALAGPRDVLSSVYQPLEALPDGGLKAFPRCAGADVVFHEASPRENGKRVFMDMRLRPEPESPPYEIEVPGLAGAGYFVRKKWFFEMQGLRGFDGWNLDELPLSLRTWLCGGRVVVMRDVVIGHVCQTRPQVLTDRRPHLLRNKLTALLTCLPPDTADRFLERVGALLPATIWEGDWYTEAREIQDALRPLWTRDVDWFCARFGALHPDDFNPDAAPRFPELADYGIA